MAITHFFHLTILKKNLSPPYFINVLKGFHHEHFKLLFVKHDSLSGNSHIKVLFLQNMFIP